ncbi:MAG: MFS transporter [Anaerolineae bacterium]|nr:MFS transporter [Anaerolineae bacterium]
MEEQQAMAGGAGPKNMRTFWIIWGGQFISMLGSGLTNFGLGVWIYEKTGQATPFALTALFSTLPGLLLLPVGGAIADRMNRRRIMILADTGAALMTAMMAALLFFGKLEIWHIYLLAGMSSVFGAFQEPAYSSSITMLVPKQQLARASGIMQMGQAITGILTPILAAVLYALIQLKGVMLIDFATYFFAVGALLLVKIPQPKREESGGSAKPSLLADAAHGWNVIRTMPGLFAMLIYFASVNFFLSLSGVLSGPLVLSYGTSTDLGIVQMAASAALLVGSLLMSVWGGSKVKKVPALIGFIALAATGLLISGLRANTFVISLGRVVMLVFIPFAAALSQAVWQVKIPANLQGRVFAIRSMIASSMTPIAFLISGPLADRVFEPMMAQNGVLANTFLGTWLGSGPGRGIGLIFILCCLFLWIESLIAASVPRIRNLETDIPDAISDDVPLPQR